MVVNFGVTVLARGLSGTGIDGIGHYSNELFKALQNIPSVDLATYSFGFPINQHILGIPTHQLSRFTLELARSTVFPWRGLKSNIRCSQVDLIHATDHLIPFVKGVPLIATLMDAIPLSHPEWVNNNAFRRVKIELWRQMAKRADRILTISQYSKNEIVNYFEIDPSRISVVPLGVDQHFFNHIKKGDREKILGKYGIENEYFLTVGTLQPRKNIERILEAMRILPEYIRKSHQLVIVGSQGWGSESLIYAIKKAEQEGWCKWLSYVPDRDLRSLLQSATLLVFPSLYEGFGLPVLEAFASNTPVVASNTTSIPEVAKDAAILIDPLDPSNIASALSRVVENKELAEILVKKGLARANEMTWQRCAEDTFTEYKKVVEEYV